MVLVSLQPIAGRTPGQKWYATATEIESRKQQEERVRKENVRLEERNRIAQELHDTLLQSFLSASIHLGALLQSVAAHSPLKPHLDRVLQIMRKGIEEGRDAIQGLRSTEPEANDLVVALSSVQQEISALADINFRVKVVGQQRQIPSQIQHEIYRIGREALVNAFRHSSANHVEVELEYTDLDLRMRVRDDGCGIEPQVLRAGRDGHYGLAGMRERAARIGGLLEISSRAASGTQVQLSIPRDVAFEFSSSDHSVRTI
jgi:signal transduction histidine kinase